MSDPGVIAKENVDRCELCRCIAETRPYGPNGEEVCFDCGMKDEESTKCQFEKHVLGKGIKRNPVRKKERGRRK